MALPLPDAFDVLLFGEWFPLATADGFDGAVVLRDAAEEIGVVRSEEGCASRPGLAGGMT